MTVRSIIIGLLVAVGLASVGYVNDVWFFFSYIGGDLLPTHAFGLLVLGLLLVNPLLGWLGRWRFRPSEWTVMLSMAFMGSVIAGSALLWQFPHPVITPIHDQIGKPAWKEKDLLQYVPRVMMVDARPTPRQPNPDVVKHYMQGMAGTGENLVGFNDVPWEAWTPTLAFWFTLLSLSFVGGICAVVVVHRQWTQREQLAYPIVTFANELIDTDERGRHPILRSRPFWIGLGVALVILLINGYHKWNTDFVAVPMGIPAGSLQELSFFKHLRDVPVGRNILNIRFYFAAVGLAYFLTSEASFSMGISGWLYVIIAAPLVARGVPLKTGFLSGGLPAFMYFGAYLGMGLIVLYLGRRYYWAVLKRAFFLPDRRGEVLAREANALRLLIVISAAMVLLLTVAGLHPLLGVGFVGLAGLLFLIIARINVSTGLFIIQPIWQPVAVLLGVFGAFALGPTALAILAMLCTVVTIDTRIAAVPLAANALKLADDQKVKPGRLAGWMSVAIVVAMIVAVIFTVWLIYSYGVSGMDSGGTNWALTVARMPFEMLNKNINDLGARLAEAREGPHLLAAAGDFFAGRANWFFAALLVGLGLVLVCSYLRLRFPRWPLHPVMFLVWGTPWTVEYAPSFLLAWLLKRLIMKYGGQRAYVKGRGFFVGLVAGELAAALFWAAVGVIYYLETGTVGTSFMVRE